MRDWHRYQLRQLSEVLGGCYEKELIARAIRSSESEPIELENALMGDGMLVEFGSAVDAVACAIEIQKHVREHDAGGSKAEPIQFRIGINVGDIIIRRE